MSRRIYKILLVDDDPNCLDAIDQILRRDGYEIIKAEQGRHALKLLSENIIDLAIIDYNLPDIDGIYILNEIKRIYRNIPIIIMTSDLSKEIKIASLEAGAYSFITKPINIPIFKDIVKKAIQSLTTKTIEIRRETIFIRWFKGFHK
ncbi:TPA: response regulator [bacterium]|nr:response regulator [bacterium]